LNTLKNCLRIPLLIATCTIVGGLAQAQSGGTTPASRGAPRIHTTPENSQAIPLPPLPNNHVADDQAATSKWVGNIPYQNNYPEQNTTSRVIQASASQSVSTTNSPSLRSNVRTRLNPPSEKATPTINGGNSTWKMLLSIGSSLMIVLGLFLGAAWCYKKAFSNSLTNLPKQVVSVLGRTHLAPRQQLVVLRFGPKLVLVSMIQGEARTISEITDPLEVDQLAGLCESEQTVNLSRSFRSLLHQTGGGSV
jgi:flagellar protein FliO/FliZ